MNIDFIYFDVGGVVILDFFKNNKWDVMLDDLGVKNEDKQRLNKIYDEEENKYCLGEKSSETFISILKNEFDIKISSDYSFLEDMVSRFEPNIELQKIIKQLKSKYKMGLLTNMYPDMLDLIISKGFFPSVQWDVIVDSSKVGFKKPQKEIFNLASNMAKTPEDKILFVENSPTHVEAAKEMGWNSLLYDPSNIQKSNKTFLKLLT